MKTPLLAACLALAACSVPPVAPPIATPVLPVIDSTLRRPCARPVSIPEKITSADVDRLWARDREALETCGDQNAVLVTTIDATRRALGGN